MDAESRLERLTRYNRNCLAALVVLLVATLAYVTRDLLVPMVFAFFIALTFRPAIKRMSMRGIPPWISAAMFIVLVAVACLGLVYVLLEPLQSWIRDAPGYARTFSERVRDIRSSMEQLISVTERLQSAAQATPRGGVQEVVVRESAFMTYIAQVTGYSAGILAMWGFALVLAAFLMASGDLFYAKLVRVLPTLHDKKKALRILYDVEQEVSAYLITVTVINAALGIAVAVSFAFLGLGSPALWGFAVFLLNFIPYIGTIAGLLLAGFMGIVTFDTLGQALVPMLVYGGWNLLENQVVTPYFLGRRLRINSVAIIVALALWTWLWGIAGTVVAVPMLVTLRVISEHLESLSAIAEFLSERHPSAAPEEPEPSGESKVILPV